jgi:hypothetical protein
MKKNAYLTTSDPFIVQVYTATETVDMFGEDMLEDYGSTLPEELLERYQKNIKEFKSIQEELNKYKQK